MLSREDIRAIKRANPLAEVVATHGIELRHSGRAYVGRCPFHFDQGRPNFYVVPLSDAADDFYHCFRCAAAGDVIGFVRRIDGLRFGQAIAQLQGGSAPPSTRQPRPLAHIRRPRPRARPWGLAERAVLSAAVTLYHHTLLGHAEALDYVCGRGIDDNTIERCRLGYAGGDELASYLTWRRLPLGAAFRLGLLQTGARERFSGRIVVPEVRAGQPIWLIGRVLGEPSDDQPKYLGLPGRGRRPLLGWEYAAGCPAPVAVESTFDWLTLVSWDIPALSLLGTSVRPPVLKALARFEHLYLALNNDQAGREATSLLVETLGCRITPVQLPDVKDISELAPRPDGQRLFRAALERPGWPTPAHLTAG